VWVSLKNLGVFLSFHVHVTQGCQAAGLWAALPEMRGARCGVDQSRGGQQF
jgi:hypothetical protein